VSLIGNRWRRWNFTLMAPFYDAIVSPFQAMRYRSIELAEVRPGDRVLLVGAGTGADVPLLPRTATVYATDYTEAMLRRVPRLRGVRVARMDGARLGVRDASMDVVLLHLIVAVIPDPLGCLREVRRVLKPGGRVAVFDKFKPAGRESPVLLRVLRPFALALGTDLTVDLEELAGRAGLRIAHREDGFADGLFQVCVLERGE
jgi:ubiquinone/menaquinone biosynthesis C-methylase UbiE